MSLLASFPGFSVADIEADAPGALPKQLNDIGIFEHLGGQISVNDLHFKDDQGQDVTLSKYFHGDKPIILALVYYECPNLCNLLLNGLSESLKNLDWTPGSQFDIVAVSINPHETRVRQGLRSPSVRVGMALSYR
jgi:protein SCO1/2